jgi:hypothetical protein
MTVGQGKKVRGVCPMGCGQTLFLGESGHVTCGFVDCPNPGMADELLHDQETEHVAIFDSRSFVLKHPLRERPDLFKCKLHEAIRDALDGPPNGVPGRYRVTRRAVDAVSESYRSGDSGLEFELLEAA